MTCPVSDAYHSIVKLAGLLLVVGLSCKSGDERLMERLDFIAGFLEGDVKELEATTTSGQPCYELVDGWVHYHIQDFGHRVAKRAHDVSTQLIFTNVMLEPSKTSLAGRFDAIARRFDGWRAGPYARATDACKNCMTNGHGSEDGAPIRSDFETCRVP